jgi:hypothetical protein
MEHIGVGRITVRDLAALGLEMSPELEESGWSRSEGKGEWRVDGRDRARRGMRYANARVGRVECAELQHPILRRLDTG